MTLRDDLDRPVTYADLLLVRDDLRARLDGIVGNVSSSLVDRLRDVLQLRDEIRDAFGDAAARFGDHERRIADLATRVAGLEGALVSLRGEVALAHAPCGAAGCPRRAPGPPEVPA